MLVGGEAGVGKSSLVRALGARLDGRARVLFGSCEHLTTPSPLAPIEDIGRELGGRSRDRARGMPNASRLARRLIAGNPPPVTRITAGAVLGRVRARRGDPGSMEALDDALALAAQGGHLQRLGQVSAARAEAAWLGADPDRCADEARAVYGLRSRSVTSGSPASSRTGSGRRERSSRLPPGSPSRTGSRSPASRRRRPRSGWSGAVRTRRLVRSRRAPTPRRWARRSRCFRLAAAAELGLLEEAPPARQSR